MISNKELSRLNKAKYAKPPSWEQIKEFMDEVEMKMFHFERFYGINFNHLAQVKSGQRNLGSSYWHIIYERIKPKYGVGFIGDYTTNSHKNRINHCLPKKLPKREGKDGHSRLGRLKE